MKLGQKCYAALVEYLGKLAQAAPLWESGHWAQKAPQATEPTGRGHMKGAAGPALSPTFKTQHKSQSAGAAQGWARARQEGGICLCCKVKRAKAVTKKDFWDRIKKPILESFPGCQWLNPFPVQGTVDPWSANQI